MRGGWRWNAGRPASHGKVERHLRLEVSRLAGAGILDGGRCDWSWAHNATGKRLGSIAIMATQAGVMLSYTCSGRDVLEAVTVLRSPCHYGGSRPWFACPRCGGRVGHLYLAHGRFACRTCHGLRYASQSEDVCGRAWRKQQKLEAKLGENWRKPKGMHRATRGRICEAIWACEMVREDVLLAYAQRLGMFDGPVSNVFTNPKPAK